MTRRHRVTFPLWVAGRWVATCDCHYGTTVQFDRPLPGGAK